MPGTQETLERKHVEHKHVDEDPVLATIRRAIDYTMAHTNLVLGIVVAILAVVALGLLWSRDQKTKAVASNDALSQVVLGYGNGQYAQAVELANGVLTNHAGSPASKLARYLLGASQLRLAQFAEAEQTLRAYVADPGENPFYVHAARAALAASLEGQSKFAEAAVIYQEEAAALAEPLAGQAQLDAARALRAAGSIGPAREILQKLAASTTTAARQAKIELAVLENSQN